VENNDSQTHSTLYQVWAEVENNDSQTHSTLKVAVPKIRAFYWQFSYAKK